MKGKDKMVRVSVPDADPCVGCRFHYEISEEEKKHFNGSIGCRSIESCGSCIKAAEEEAYGC